MLLGWVKPEYVLRPCQLVRRARCLVAPEPSPFVTRRLPWRLDIRVRPQEVIGQSVVQLGVYDLLLTEAL
jgi:hypothetical protein